MFFNIIINVDDASFALGWCSNECLGDEEDDGEDN